MQSAELRARPAAQYGRRRAGAAHGATAPALTEASGALDLLVPGSRGYGPVKRLLVGSTSARLLHTARCPVLVLPRGAREPRAPAPDTALVAP